MFNTYKVKECDPAFGIILDCSGSMWGEGIKSGKFAMIVLHETLKILGINHSIITHNSDGHHQSNIRIYQDFREGYRIGQQMAREAGIYMQKYCGCVYSEEESARFREERAKKKAERKNK